MKDSLLEVKSLMARMYKLEGQDVYCEILNEDRASKQSIKARKVIMNVLGDSYKWNDVVDESGKTVINEFEEYLRQNMQIKSKSYPDSNVSYEFEPGIARICYGELNLNPYKDNAYWKLISAFRKVMEYISLNAPEQYDENLNGYSLSHFVEKYKKFFEEEFKDKISDTEIIKTPNNNRFTIKQIDSFSEASEYKGFFENNQKDTWCITKQMSFFNMYSNSFKNKIYFCMVDNPDDIKPEQGVYYPYDKYGLSMICVVVNKENKPVSITLRWNHRYGAPGDDAFNLDKEEFFNITGISFNSVFAPYTDEETKKLREENGAIKNKIDENTYFNFLKTGFIPCDEMENFNGDYAISYIHKDFIYYNDDYDEWCYVNPTDSPDYNEEAEYDNDEEMIASLVDCSVACIIDRKNKKIIDILEQTDNHLFRFKNSFFTFKNGEVFSGLKNKIVAKNVIRCEKIYSYLVLTMKDKFYYILDGLSGEFLIAEGFESYTTIGGSSVYIFYNKERVLFIGRNQEEINGLIIPNKDFVGKRPRAAVFIKDGKTHIFATPNSKYKIIEGIYDNLKDAAPDVPDKFILFNSNCDETILVTITNNDIETSIPIKGEYKHNVVYVLDENRYVFVNGYKEYNVFNLLTKKCEFENNFYIENFNSPLKILKFIKYKKYNCLYNDNLTKKLLTTVKNLSLDVVYNKYTIFNVDYKNHYLYDNNKQEILKDLEIIDATKIYSDAEVSVINKNTHESFTINCKNGEIIF